MTRITKTSITQLPGCPTIGARRSLGHELIVDQSCKGNLNFLDSVVLLLQVSKEFLNLIANVNVINFRDREHHGVLEFVRRRRGLGLVAQRNQVFQKPFVTKRLRCHDVWFL